MIIYDNSETRKNSQTPRIRKAEKCLWLEERTGADIMISALNKLPFTKRHMRKHFNNKSYLVQVKIGEDLTASVGSRMNTSISKMVKAVPYQGQRILLFVGTMEEGNDDLLLINGVPTRSGIKYWQLRAAIAKWMDRGGVFEQVSDKKAFRQWIKIKEQHTLDNLKEPDKTIFPAPTKAYEDDPGILQNTHVVNDARQLIVNLPGIGAKRANDLWAEFGNAGDILCYLTNPKQQRIKGIGVKTINNIREFLGLDDVFQLSLEVTDEALQRNKDYKPPKKKMKQASF